MAPLNSRRGRTEEQIVILVGINGELLVPIVAVSDSQGVWLDTTPRERM